MFKKTVVWIVGLTTLAYASMDLLGLGVVFGIPVYHTVSVISLGFACAVMALRKWTTEVRLNEERYRHANDVANLATEVVAIYTRLTGQGNPDLDTVRRLLPNMPRNSLLEGVRWDNGTGIDGIPAEESHDFAKNGWTYARMVGRIKPVHLV